MESQEIVVELRENGVETSYARQLKINILIDGVRTVKLLPLWVITVAKIEDNVNLLRSTTGILNFLIKIQVYKSKEETI